MNTVMVMLTIAQMVISAMSVNASFECRPGNIAIFEDGSFVFEDGNDDIFSCVSLHGGKPGDFSQLTMFTIIPENENEYHVFGTIYESGKPYPESFITWHDSYYRTLPR